MPSDYFDEASKYFEEKKFDKALSAYQYIVDNHPRNELFPRSYYNIGLIYFNLKQFDKALTIFNTILKSNFNEKENFGGGIMADPFTNYKHRACELISDIYYDRKIYDTALVYFAMSDTTYPYIHFCGNEYAANDVHTSLRYADIYQKLNMADKAIESLLPSVFISLADNSKIIAELKKLLTNKKYIRIELDEALINIYPKKIMNENYTYTRYYFKFLNTEIPVPESYEDDKKIFNKDKAINEIQKTEFYKMIENL
jgi:tetratricopeptide (TPR) repeat protein